jgi:hypothetical protein
MVCGQGGGYSVGGPATPLSTSALLNIVIGITIMTRIAALCVQPQLLDSHQSDAAMIHCILFLGGTADGSRAVLTAKDAPFAISYRKHTHFTQTL